MKILLLSTYELGRQPFGLASPAAHLQAAGHDVRCLDLSLQHLDTPAIGEAELVAFYLPMHTATRIALAVIDKVRTTNPAAALGAYGLYAPISEAVLRQRGVQRVFGGEFEPQLAAWAGELAGATHGAADCAPDAPQPADGPPEGVSWQRQEFLLPRRDGLPPLTEYAGLVGPDGRRRTVGYTEASRGCKHLCRHCPVVPVYRGRFRVVQPDVVIADIDQQVAAGAEHITFGDPDFLNGPRHALAVVRELHRRHAGLTYDVTVKVEHLLRNAALLPELAATGCAFVVSAVEAVDDDILEKLDKGHTAADFERVVQLCHDAGVPLQPTFVAFNPWITLRGYRELLATLARLDLVDNVPSIQLAIRLLIPAGSLLLELHDVRELIGPFDPRTLGFPWAHADPRVDALQRDIEALVSAAGEGADRREMFGLVWELARTADDGTAVDLPPLSPGRPRVTIPYLTEPWYC